MFVVNYTRLCTPLDRINLMNYIFIKLFYIKAFGNNLIEFQALCYSAFSLIVFSVLYVDILFSDFVMKIH